MTATRRDLLRGGLAATALGLAGACGRAAPVTPATAPAPAPAPGGPRRILILGGTGFLGPKTIDAALARGHTVTIFNRGKREKLQPLAQQVEHLYGNRDPALPADDERGPDGGLLRPDGGPRGLEQLRGRTFDVVIDNSGYVPRLVQASAELLAGSAAQYIFISSISAYAEAPPAGGDEGSQLATLADPTVETMGPSFENYGGLKVLCERAARAAFGARATIVRPGFIIGPGDPTDRFTYWPARIAQGGDVLAPGAASDPLQWIDVRDLATWLVHLAEAGTGGTFNALGPSTPARWGDVLAACTAATPGARLVWVPTPWLAAHGQGGEEAFPIWIAPTGAFAGFHRWRNERARAAGLTFRPIADTVIDLLAWYPTEIERRVRIARALADAARARGASPPTMADPAALRAGPTRDEERALLAAFAAGPAR